MISKGYIIDRILGRCERCNSDKNPIYIVEVFIKAPKKNCPIGVYSPFGYNYRLAPRMFCESCVEDGARDMLETGMKGFMMVRSYKRSSELVRYKEIVG